MSARNPSVPEVESLLLDSQTIADIRRAEEQRVERVRSGRAGGALERAPVPVRILMVVDGSISFSPGTGFNLGTVLETLRASPRSGGWWASLHVTCAHREEAPEAPAVGTPAHALYGVDFQNFRFDQEGFSIDDYDQVWLFGIHGEGHPTALTDRELEIIARWMDRGGGVFATGDHEDLGAALCMRIPRVRSMRKWRHGEAPGAHGPDRHDTLRKGRAFWNEQLARDEGEFYTFDDESDDVPTPIVSPPSGEPDIDHPLLAGPLGRIRFFPDHPHEGWVVRPTNLTETLQCGSYACREYPQAPQGLVAPEIIAWLEVLGNRRQGDLKGPVNPRKFGAVGAYDGHRTSVGRVVVDSTWHHWFDINLVGRDPEAVMFDSGDERKTRGFLASEEGIAWLEQIKAYFSNVATWLTPALKLRQMAQRLLGGAIERYPLAEELSTRMSAQQAGQSALAALPPFAGLDPAGGDWLPLLLPELEPLHGPDAVLPSEGLSKANMFALGGALLELLRSRKPAHGTPPMDGQQQGEALRRGALMGLHALREQMQQEAAGQQRGLEAMGRSLAKLA